jgi:CheY-like chemotaxis protein
MPILSGLEAIKFIRQTNKTTPIITYSATYQNDMDAIVSEIPNTYYCQKNSIVIRDILRNSILSKSRFRRLSPGMVTTNAGGAGLYGTPKEKPAGFVSVRNTDD